MKKEDFYIGQRIIYKDRYGSQKAIKATVIKIATDSITFHWNIENPSLSTEIILSIPETFANMTPEETLTSQERINKRIKKLWNESNYVKNNPALQY